MPDFKIPCLSDEYLAYTLLIGVTFGFNVASFNLYLIENEINVSGECLCPNPEWKCKYRIVARWQRPRIETERDAKGLMTRVKVFGLSMKEN